MGQYIKIYFLNASKEKKINLETSVVNIYPKRSFKELIEEEQLQ